MARDPQNRHQRHRHRTAARDLRITGADQALDVVRLAASEPRRPETVALLLDDGHVGRTCFVVDGTTNPDDVVEVARLVAEVAEREAVVHAVVLASIRLGVPAPDERGHDGARRDDLDRWLELLDLFDDIGVELLDWYVVAGGQSMSLRSATGMPTLWRDAC